MLLFAVLGGCANKKIKVGLIPFQELPIGFSDSLANSIASEFGLITYQYPETAIPPSAYINVKSPRYRADSILAFLNKIRPDSINYILGICTVDISATKRDALGAIKKPESTYRDWGIFGLANCPGHSAVISTFRLKSKKSGQILERFRKIGIHELGHNLGLKHCTNKSCVMRDAVESISTIDNVNIHLCTKCRAIID